jgi:hypothetical protein
MCVRAAGEASIARSGRRRSTRIPTARPRAPTLEGEGGRGQTWPRKRHRGSAFVHSFSPGRHSGVHRQVRARNPSCRNDTRRNGFRARAYARPGMKAFVFCTPPQSRGMICPGSARSSLPSNDTRAQGMPGASTQPQPRVKRKTHELVTAGSPETFRHSPREWF